MDWQETFLPDSRTGELHIADVRTDHDLVIEFQHSHIDPAERTAREKFYKNMVWVVDGMRLKRDYPRFKKHIEELHPIRKGLFRVSFPEFYVPAAWLESSVPVIFDFRNEEVVGKLEVIEPPLYCLFPKRIARDAVFAEVSRKAFISSTLNGEWSVRCKSFMNEITVADQEWKKQWARPSYHGRRVVFRGFNTPLIRKRRRRF